MTDIDSAVNGITRIASVGVVAGVSMKVLDNMNRLSNPSKRKRHRKTHRRKH